MYPEDYYKYYSQDYQNVLFGTQANTTTTTPTPTSSNQQKTAFWDTGFGKGLTSLWNFGTSNPDKILSLVDKNKSTNTNPIGAGEIPIRDGGPIGGNTGTNGNTPTPTNNNNTIILAIMGVGVVIVLFLLFKNK